MTLGWGPAWAPGQQDCEVCSHLSMVPFDQGGAVKIQTVRPHPAQRLSYLTDTYPSLFSSGEGEPLSNGMPAKTARMGFEGAVRRASPSPGRPPPRSLPVPPAFPEKGVPEQTSFHAGGERQVTDKNCPVYFDSKNVLFNLG